MKEKHGQNNELITFKMFLIFINSKGHILLLKRETNAKSSYDNQTIGIVCNKQLINLFLEDDKKKCFCLFEDENKSCVRWCYPPNFAKNLTLLTIDRHPTPGLGWMEVI